MALFTDKETRLEIARYNMMPVRFTDFLDTGWLRCGELELVCVEKRPSEPLRARPPTYYFEIRERGSRVGAISLRVGYSRSMYYTGQIGYAIDPPFRGRGFAGMACRMLAPLMRSHGMTKVLITNNPENIASRRVCEKLGAKLLRQVKIPRWHEMYSAGERYKNIFEWDIR